MTSSLDFNMARHGAMILLLGLLTGFFINSFTDRHLGNATHLTGLIGGYGLIALGAIWPKLTLSRRWSRIGTVSTIVGMYLNFFGLILRDRVPARPLFSGLVLALASLFCLISVVVALAGLKTSSKKDSHA